MKLFGIKFKGMHIGFIAFLYFVWVFYNGKKHLKEVASNSNFSPAQVKQPLHLRTTNDVWALPSMVHFKYSAGKQKLMDRMSEKSYARIHDKYCSNAVSCTNLCKKFNFLPLKPEEQAVHKPRLFYGTIFNNEVDVVELALYEMGDYIHSLSIVEANVSFSGLPRVMNFPKYAQRLSNYSHKINYFPWHQKSPNETFFHKRLGSAYGREAAIRNSIKDQWILLGMKPTDLAIVADADEFVNREFLSALRLCNVFPVHTDSLMHNLTQHENKDYLRVVEDVIKSQDMKKIPKASTLAERCNNKTKVMARINQYSYYVDCPQISQYWNLKGETLKGIKIYWHPDIVPAECVIHSDATRITVERLRTWPGSVRLLQTPVGWHYRNQNMRPEDVLFKYLNYGHPNESSLAMVFNITANMMNTTHIMYEMQRDCQHRLKLFKEVNYKKSDLPLLLQDDKQRERFRHLYHNYTEFYNLLL